MTDERVRQAIEKNLSGMHISLENNDAIMHRIRGGTKVKKKLSLGLVLAIVLILMVMTAVAAITLNAYYEKVIETEGEYGLIQDWPAKDKVALVNWMVEAGIELNSVKVEALNNSTLSDEEQGVVAMELINGYYPARDGILSPVDIIAKEKGPFEYWSLEDQAWFSEMMTKYQPEESSSVNLMPTENDITQEQAISVMYAFYEKEYGLKRENFNEEKMTVSFSEGIWDDGNGPTRLKTWSMDLWLKDSPNPMGISILPNGTVKQATPPYVRSWEDDWYDTFMSDGFFTIEGMYRFQQEWGPRLQQILDDDLTRGKNDLVRLLEQNYGLPHEGDLTRDDAFAVARDAILELPNWTEEKLSCYGTREAYLEELTGQNKYHFVFTYWTFPMSSDERQRATEWHYAGELPQKVIVQIDALSGEILELREDNNIEGANRLGF